MGVLLEDRTKLSKRHGAVSVGEPGPDGHLSVRRLVFQKKVSGLRLLWLLCPRYQKRGYLPSGMAKASEEVLRLRRLRLRLDKVHLS